MKATVMASIGKVSAILLLVLFSGTASGLQSATASEGQVGERANASAIAILKSQMMQAESVMAQLKLELVEKKNLLKEFETREAGILQQQNELGISTESFSRIVENLQTQRIDLVIDLAGLEARRMAIEELSANSPENEVNRELIQLLQQNLEMVQRSYDRNLELYKRGSQSESSRDLAAQEVLNARIRLLEARSSGSGNGSPAGNQQLQELSIERAEKKARLDTVESLLARILPERNGIRELERFNGQKIRMLQEMARMEDAVREQEAKILEYQAELESRQLLNSRSDK